MRNPVLPRLIDSDDVLPEEVQGYISVRGTESVFDKPTQTFSVASKPYHAKKGDRGDVRRNIEKSGFSVMAESPLGFAVAAPAPAYEDISRGKMVTRELWTRIAPGVHRYVTRVDLIGNNQPQALGVGYAASRAAKIDGIVLEKPRYTHGARPMADPSPIPPNSPKFHLTVPTGVGTALNASPIHQQGIRGENVSVAMVDTGHYKHPFFLAQGYNLKPTLTAIPGVNPGKDPGAHGTGESANIFAAAPGVIFQGIRASKTGSDLLAAFGGFVMAKNLEPKPRIITCSWGTDYDYPPAPPWKWVDEADKALALEIRHAVEQGIVVIFSAGNGQFGPEPQVPGVISAGGVYMSPTGSLWASDYASGYESPWFGGVRVPTVCGLVGMRPRAQYIMLPVPSGSELDRSESQDEPEEVGDGTSPRDGWALFSGTSAAAPQLAGVSALILGVKPNLKPAQVMEAMVKTATDITSGTSHPRFAHPATVGPDLATGAGLVNAKAAVEYAKQKF